MSINTMLFTANAGSLEEYIHNQNPSSKPLVDVAITADGKLTKGPGGIDLTPANMHLQTQHAGEGIKFHLDPAMLEQLRNAPGFVPVIIDIQPLKSLPEFLGLNQESAVPA